MSKISDWDFDPKTKIYSINPVAYEAAQRAPFLTDAEFRTFQPHTYTWEEMARWAIYKDTPDVESGDLSGGVSRLDELPDSVCKKLSTISDKSNGEDASKRDAHVFRSLLEAGMCPADAKATFLASARGRNAVERKKNHADDYIDRTVRHAQSVANAEKGNRLRKIRVDFTETQKKKGFLKTKSGVVVQQMHLAEIRRQKWLWPGYIPQGTVTVLAGDPSTGKSTLVLDLISRITNGKPMPFSDHLVDVGRCAIATAEDAVETTINPRLREVAAKRALVEAIHVVEIDGKQCPFSLPRDLEMIRQYIRERHIVFMVVDPFSAFLGADKDNYRDQDMRSILRPIMDIAEETGCTIVLIAHYNKNERQDRMYRISGSFALTAAARSVLAVKPDDKDDRIKLLYLHKLNLAERPPSIKYRMVGAGIVSRVDWLEETDYNPMRGSKDDPDEFNDWLHFCKQTLVDGSMASDDFFNEARKIPLSKSTFANFKHALGITSEKVHGHWVLKRPDKWPERMDKTLVSSRRDNKYGTNR